ncbi:HD-GYP domain-containing protein [Conexibacter woesei]|uniref:HD-GYP domain-containing protein n=1 Tax=Conexibacter woesei TaxID=191495 RepID=UPI000424FE41|nr:diguanylate cyclase [Conexibacter woesei]
MFSESRRLRDELRTTHARIAVLEAERNDYLRKDRRAGVLTLDAFREAAAAALRGTQRRGEAAALVLVDIDGFRALNGRRGAAAGDEALAAVAQRLRELVRGGDVVGRTGADELAVVMPGANLAGARGVAERLVAVLEQVGPVTVSAGIAVDSGTGQLDGLMADASAILERARIAGGNRVGAPGRQPTVEPSRGAIGALALALSERDRGTGQHAEQVVALAGAVARRLNLDAEEVERIAAAALLHDIGKVAVPDSILSKPGPLNDEEWSVMRGHSAVGEKILRAVPGLGPVARMVRHGHESWDGSGYPDGLSGHDIPLGSRIVLACDAYDAMTSTRPYRDAMSHEDAVAELAAKSGTQFDPQVVGALLGYLEDRRPVDYAARRSAAAAAAAR